MVGWCQLSAENVSERQTTRLAWLLVRWSAIKEVPRSSSGALGNSLRCVQQPQVQISVSELELHQARRRCFTAVATTASQVETVMFRTRTRTVSPSATQA